MGVQNSIRPIRTWFRGPTRRRLRRAWSAAGRAFPRKLAHELKPENWNYKRQAWNLGDIEADYGTTRQEAFRSGIPMYPPLELPDPE